uniref:PID domain-containing protein n=1 Tax=Steinernema glaseri TaxID=37863 RepID=A0A1I8ASL9_9BILA
MKNAFEGVPRLPKFSSEARAISALYQVNTVFVVPEKHGITLSLCVRSPLNALDHVTERASRTTKPLCVELSLCSGLRDQHVLEPCSCWPPLAEVSTLTNGSRRGFLFFLSSADLQWKHFCTFLSLAKPHQAHRAEASGTLISSIRPAGLTFDSQLGCLPLGVTAATPPPSRPSPPRAEGPFRAGPSRDWHERSSGT